MPSVTTKALPIIDVGAALSLSASKPGILRDIRSACEQNGFFVITNHGVSRDLQRKMFEQARFFFDLPLDQKLAVDESLADTSHRGYQRIGGEAYQAGKLPDLKEGFQYGREQPASKRVLTGPNLWPENQILFRDILMEYFNEVRSLSIVIFKLISESLDLDFDVAFKRFCTDEACAVRLLHYPPQKIDASEDQLGTGAHTDFGGLTLLLTDEVGGLQIFDNGSWTEVPPCPPGAYIVNLGDAFMRLTGGLYRSSLHRVLNKSTKHRYSIPFFSDGNLDTILKPVCGNDSGEPYLTVEEHMNERMSQSRKRALEDQGRWSA